ncbi:hypothetical protein [Staphylococcus phage vB_SauM-V1SA20]|nr:hypothetical protein [Staphylococcus phage vB_SauM-V1SA20]
MYIPYFLISGRTSEVTQRLNRLADSSFDEKIKLYKPDSLINVTVLN